MMDRGRKFEISLLVERHDHTLDAKIENYRFFVEP